MTDDDSVLREKVAQLLGEPRPQFRTRNHTGTYSGTPIGFAINAFVTACALVDAANYVEALRGWEESQNELRSWHGILDAGPADAACREAMSAALDDLLMRFAVRCGTTVGLSEQLSSACKRVQQLVDCCANHQAEIRATTEVRLAAETAAEQSVRAAAREDALACYRIAGKKIQIEAQRVLLLHKQTAEIAARELYEQTGQMN
ncbi:hypothetical protein [Mycobacterium intracellulare]|uniref:hypothetical protein n=1 Tax=Mycobacterium intracellulare TaxID=1767 RepID=UPI000C7AB5F6|nr:hypothetical protein [Mycobacterium intracellulare]